MNKLDAIVEMFAMFLDIEELKITAITLHRLKG